jgi:hypothetical protein
MPATLTPTIRVLRAAPQLGHASRKARCKSCVEGIRAAKPEELPIAHETPAKPVATASDDVVGATFGWLLAALIMVPLLTIATLPVTTTAIVLITGLALFVTLPLSYVLAKQSTAVRLIGLGIYAVVDVTLTVVGLLLDLLSALG